jgi:hypothetical protein
MTSVGKNIQYQTYDFGLVVSQKTIQRRESRGQCLHSCQDFKVYAFPYSLAGNAAHQFFALANCVANLSNNVVQLHHVIHLNKILTLRRRVRFPHHRSCFPIGVVSRPSCYPKNTGASAAQLNFEGFVTSETKCPEKHLINFDDVHKNRHPSTTGACPKSWVAA